MKKGFSGILVLIVVLVVAVGAGAYYLGTQKSGGTPLVQSPTPLSTTSPVSVEIANWKTYKNEQYHFEFQYPPKAQMTTEFSDRVNVKIGRDSPIPSGCSEFSFTVVFEGSDLKNRMTKEKFYQFKISNRDGQRLDGISRLEGHSCTYTDIFIPNLKDKSRNDFFIRMTRQSAKYPNLFDQIFSTFKFTE